MPNDRLPNDVKTYVKAKCASGAFKDGTGVIAAAVRGMRAQERIVARMAEAIGRGLQDGTEGRVKDAETVFKRLERKYVNMAKARNA